MSTNSFAILELEDDVIEKRTTDFTRKAKKKMREIEALKAKSSTTDEEKCKIQEEDFWKRFTPSNKKIEIYNPFNISNSFRKCCVKNGDECPICLNTIPTNMSVVTNCNHPYCRVCVTNLINTSQENKIKCSLCRNKITNLDFQNEDNMFEIMGTLSKKNKAKPKQKKQTVWMREYNADTQTMRELLDTPEWADVRAHIMRRRS
jgi:hypothetical protein